jgi:K+-sensing histidine kinase KdpD
MKKIKLTPNMLTNSLKGMLTAIAITIPMWLIGRNVLGEAVISLLYLAPIAWSANKWGQAAGMSAALTAALCFDFLFIPPFYPLSSAAWKAGLYCHLLCHRHCSCRAHSG